MKNKLNQLLHSHLNAIMQLRFITELASGTLDPAIFEAYLQQDQVYLITFSDALKKISALAPDPLICQQLEYLSAGAQAESPLLSTTHQQATTLTQACTDYQAHLTHHAELGYEHGLAACLPCFWIYAQVGERLAGAITAHHPYAHWISFYASPDFKAQTEHLLLWTVDALTQASEKFAAHLLRVIFRSCELEYDFWHEVYPGLPA